MVAVGQVYSYSASLANLATLTWQPDAGETYVLLSASLGTSFSDAFTVNLTDGVNTALLWQPYFTPAVGVKLSIPFIRTGLTHDVYLSIYNESGGAKGVAFSAIRIS